MQFNNKRWIKTLVAVSFLVSQTVSPAFAANGKHTNTNATQASSQPMVITPDVPHLPWKMENGVKVFHLSAEIIQREILPASDMGPAKRVKIWGYNGSVPGPTIEVTEPPS